MGLLNKIFRGTDEASPESEAASGTRFQENDDLDDESLQREASRRELVKLVLRESMRRHAVPSDWIECRMLPVVTSNSRTGVHVQLIVKQGQARLINYIPAFQSSLMAEVEKHEPRAWDWLLSISWQFAGITSSTGGVMPGAAEWDRPSAPAPPGSAAANSTSPAPAAPHVEDEDDPEIAQDLKALFAIRDAVLTTPDDREPTGFEATRPVESYPNEPPKTLR